MGLFVCPLAIFLHNPEYGTCSVERRDFRTKLETGEDHDPVAETQVVSPSTIGLGGLRPDHATSHKASRFDTHDE